MMSIALVLKAAIPQFLLSLRLVIFLRCPSTSMTCGAAFSRLARSANASLALVLQEALFKCTKTMKKSSKKARPTGSVAARASTVVHDVLSVVVAATSVTTVTARNPNIATY